MTLRTLLVKLGFKGDVGGLEKFDKKISGLKTNVLGLSAIFASATVTLGYFLNEAAKLEQTKIAFEVMTNSVQLGQKLIKDLFTFARTTPFRIPGVLQASKILLAMGITADEQMDTLEKLGHVAAGINKPLDQLASIFGRVKAAGYLTGYEMERLRRAGVPLGQYLSEMLKKPEREILHMIRSKQISFEVFAEAWELMVEKRFPKLMDKLLLTFKGIVSNIQDYIYEIVAFSGEELLPVFKLMANQLMFLLDSSRELIGLKFKQFFRGVSSALELMNKGFIKLYFRTRETITQFGGINKLFKIFSVFFGAFVGIKSLALLGRIGKIVFTMLSFASLKLALIGAAMIGIALATEDILGFLSGKKSTIGYILNLIEEKIPKIHKILISILTIVKEEIEGLSLLLIGLFTGNEEAMIAGMKQTQEAWNKIVKIYEKAIEKISSKIKGLGLLMLGISTMNPVLVYSGIRMLDTKEGKGQKPYTENMNFSERTIGKSSILSKLAEYTEKAKNFTDKVFQPGGAPEAIEISPMRLIQKGLDDIKSDINIARQVARQRKEYKEERKRQRLNFNTTINITDLPKNATSKEVSKEAIKQMENVFDRKFNYNLISGFSAVEPSQE